MFALRCIALVFVSLLVGTCGSPPLVLIGAASLPVAPSGPPVAALIANLKCELWEAANDTSTLPYYLDLPGLPLHPPSRHPSPDRFFNLKNLFVEIEYVADFKLTLQVTDTGALNPSADFIKPLPVSMTNLTLAVGGQISGQGDRYIDIYQSVDFSRLVASPVNPLYKKWNTLSGDKLFPELTAYEKVPVAKRLARPPNEIDESPCDHGFLLGGKLGLKEDLATYAIATAMQDAAVLLQPGSGTSGGTLFGQQISLTGFSGYAFGEMDSQIDFTVLMDVNGGPNWTLITFKGPNVTSAGGANGQGLLNISRQAKDTVFVTVLPVCIRQKYFPKQWLKLPPDKIVPQAASPSTSYTVRPSLEKGALETVTQDTPPKNALSLTYPVDYTPEPIFGTGTWANYLPPCWSPAGQAALASAPAIARTNNQLQGIPNLLETPRLR